MAARVSNNIVIGCMREIKLIFCLQAMRDIVAKCLVKDPSKRPTAAQLLDHKFFKVRANNSLLNSLNAVILL